MRLSSCGRSGRVRTRTSVGRSASRARRVAVGARRAALALALLAALAGASRVEAHPLAPALLELRELADGAVAVTWRVSRWRAPGRAVRPALPTTCRSAGPVARTATATAIEERWSLHCEGPGLVGQRVAVDGLAERRIDAIVRVDLRDGRSLQHVLRPGGSGWVVPERARPLALLGDYAVLGFRHLVAGLDHLLFVFGLVLLVRDTRRLVATITAFTVGHSLTLALAVLGVVRVPVALVEFGIAASLFVLALELSWIAGREPSRGPTSWMERRPWVMAGGFGLLHGLGFAAALSQAGLPQGEIPLALLGFNLGIELGQLAFVAVLLVVGAGLAPWLPLLPGRVLRVVQQVPVYAMGSLAAFWCLERATRLG